VGRWVLWLGAAALVAASLSLPAAPPAGGPAPGFTFAAGGDHATGPNFQASADRVAAFGPDFYLALGDLSYSAGEQSWCDEFKSRFDAVELITGNHDSGENPPEGDIDQYVQYCPYTLADPLTGSYGREYYFDYPSAAPLARFILISPGIVFKMPEGRWAYAAGDAHYLFVEGAIDAARAAGIPWVIVAMHKHCVAAWWYGCEVGTDVWDLLLDRKVDLILQAHSHTYERSKQLALDPATCAAVVPDAYDADCVVDDGADALYAKGGGAVTVIDGVFGASIAAVNLSDPEAPYFAALMGNNTAGVGWGFMRYAVTPSRIDAQTDLSGTFQDAFSIVASPPPAPNSLDGTLANGGLDVRLTWNLSNPETAVDHYEVWRGTAYDAARIGYNPASPDLPKGTASWTDAGAGAAPGNAFYSVRAVSLEGLVGEAPGQAGKIARALGPGANLVSDPFQAAPSPVGNSLGGVTGWSSVRTFDPDDADDPWQATYPGWPGDLLTADRATGLWLNLPGAAVFTVAGRVPCSATIALRAGWNLVGVPRMAPAAVSNVTAGLAGPLMIEGYAGEAPYHLQILDPVSSLEVAGAYWVHSPADQLWTLVNDPDPACT